MYESAPCQARYFFCFCSFHAVSEAYSRVGMTEVVGPPKKVSVGTKTGPAAAQLIG